MENNDQRAFRAETVAEQEAAGVGTRDASAPTAYIQATHLEKAKDGAYLCRVEGKFREGMGFVPIYTSPVRVAASAQQDDPRMAALVAAEQHVRDSTARRKERAERLGLDSAQQDEREAFEAEYRRHYGVPSNAELNFPDVPSAWAWWQKGRAALSQPHAGGTLSEDQWIALAERHAKADWNAEKPDGYFEAIKAVCADFAILARSIADASNTATGQGLTPEELKSAAYLNNVSQPNFMHCEHLAPINAFVQRLLAAPAAPAPTQDRNMVMRDVQSDVEHLGIGFYLTRNNDSIQYLPAHQVTIMRKSAAPAPAAQADEQITCIRKLFDGGLFDLTDSPKSFMENVIRIVGQQSAASEPAAQAMLDGDAIFAAMYARDPYWDAQGRSSAAAVRLALDCIRQQSAAPAEPAQADGLTIDLMHESYHQIIDAYVAAFAPPPEVMGNDIIGHVCKMISDAATPAGAASEAGADTARLDWLLHKISGKELRRLNIETISGGPQWGRVAIDAAMQRTAAPQPAPATGDEREAFERWHNTFYGPQDKYNPVRSLAFDSHNVGLGYDDPTVQAQFVAFCGASAAHRREDQRLTCDEFRSARYLNEISQPGFMHYPNIAPINAYVQRVVAAMQRTAAPAQTDTEE